MEVRNIRKQIVVNQHYIPQCILANFSNDKGQVYEALVDKKKVYLTNYRNSMSERYTYEHSMIEVNSLEKYFGRIESYIGPVIKNIIDAIEQYEEAKYNFADIQHLIERYMREFIIFYYRSGALLQEFSFERKKKEDRVLLLLGKLRNSQYIKELSKTIINYYEFAIIKSSDNNFILSDQYISTAALEIKNRFSNVTNRQIGFKNTIILIPISSKYYAIYYNGNIPDYINKNCVNELSQEQIDEINDVIINNSYVKCVGYNKSTLDKALIKFKYRSPSAVYAEFNSGAIIGATLKKEVFFYERDKKVWEFFTSAIWIKYKNLGRNDRCLCGSGKKFKKCCIEYYKGARRIMDRIIRKENPLNYKVSKYATVEKSIDEFYSRPSKMKKSIEK